MKFQKITLDGTSLLERLDAGATQFSGASTVARRWTSSAWDWVTQNIDWLACYALVAVVASVALFYIPFGGLLGSSVLSCSDWVRHLCSALGGAVR